MTKGILKLFSPKLAAKKKSNIKNYQKKYFHAENFFIYRYAFYFF